MPSREISSQTASLPQSLTIPLLNPLPLLSYALKIADEALYVSGAEPETKSGEVSPSSIPLSMLSRSSRPLSCRCFLKERRLGFFAYGC